MIWIEFLLCASLLTYFAYHLCKEGAIVSEKTKISEGLIGMFFLAVATSFPEIITSTTAVCSFGRIGLGYGDIMGSVIVNLMILFALDVCYKKGRLLKEVSYLTGLTGIFALIVSFVILVGAGMHLSNIGFSVFGKIGIESVIIILIYFAYLEKVRRAHPPGHVGEGRVTSAPLWKVWAKFTLFLGMVILLGVWMAKIGDGIVSSTNLSQTFTGTLILGVATSLPEIIVSFAAFRAGSVDMAVGNVLGSNLFDVCIIPLLDFLTDSPILCLLTTGQVIATILVLVLSAIAVVGLLSKKAKNRRINWDTGLIFAIGFIGFVILYFVK